MTKIENWNFGNLATTKDVVDKVEALRSYLVLRGQDRYGLSEHVSQELVQEAYIKVNNQVTRGRPVYMAGLHQFLRTSFDNLCIDNKRRQAISPFERPIDLRRDVREQKTPFEELVEKEEASIVLDELNKLPSIYANALFHYATRTHSTKQVAEKEGVNAKVLRHRFNYAKEKLKKRLSGLVD